MQGGGIQDFTENTAPPPQIRPFNGIRRLHLKSVFPTYHTQDYTHPFAIDLAFSLFISPRLPS